MSDSSAAAGDSTDPVGEAAVQRLADTERLLVALDVDGTLAPLSDEPMSVRMLPAARAAVLALAALPGTTVALVSGRTLHDLRTIAEHTDDSPLLLAGSHGAEYWSPGERERGTGDDAAASARRDALRRRAETLVESMPGAWIEPKTFGFAVHTRLADADTAAAANAAVDALIAAEAPQWRRRTGHDIVEYASRTEGKDTAVRVLRERTAATAVLFAGDDVTDEDALASLGPGDLGVLVGDRPTHATLTVPDIPAMAALLRRLAELRAGRTPVSRGPRPPRRPAPRRAVRHGSRSHPSGSR
ncbi:MAG: trehalose-phosphatase [Micropruina sp.]|uniref:trehalose-phosphatase n=1 Tax=Micropruina sp. TaxID=2737536 RepID=UPI0039E5970D